MQNDYENPMNDVRKPLVAKCGFGGQWKHIFIPKIKRGELRETSPLHSEKSQFANFPIPFLIFDLSFQSASHHC
jgi:hypothetical protein